ncbi:AraC family transcriptional regulator [Methylobacterium nigriterrae]|uniref:AraC family transcriptional regulator n=1 Tax=Methylobacterium nigriterrae TaxID=3127512 RepID=UPI00301388DE
MLSSVGLHTKDGPNGAAADEGFDAAEKAPPAGFIQLDIVQALHAVLVELGADLDDLLTEADLDPRLFDGGHRLVSFTDVGHLIALAVDRTRCPHLGLLVGQRTTLASLGLLGRLIRSSDTVGEALRALETHLCVQNRGAAVGLGVYDDIVVLNYAPHQPEAEGAAHHAERGLAMVTNVLRALCGPDWAPLEALLPRSAPRDTGPYVSFFHAPVRFDAETASLVFSAELLAQRIAGADPAVRQRVEERICRLEAAEPSSLTDKLREYLQTVVTRQRCKAEGVARLRLVNRRTLSRHLQAEGTSFRRLANEAQFRVAKKLLADTCMTLAQISATLSFSEPAAFTHAFRRWAGMTPSAWRQANRPEAMRDQRYEDPRPRGRRASGCSGMFTPGPALL